MRIIQIINELVFGHAVSNHVLAIKRLLAEAGVDSDIYCEKIENRLSADVAKMLDQLPTLNENDIIIYHLRVKSDWNRKVAKLAGKKILIYHVLTPANFLEPFDDKVGQLTREGLQEVEDLLPYIDCAFEPSPFDVKELVDFGFPPEKIALVPYILPLDDYKAEPDAEIMKLCQDGKTNILFVSRIVPNKKQEDAIAAFAYYKRNFNNDARLILPGRIIFKKYKEQLDEYIQALGLSEKDVLLPGSIPFSQILAYYASSDIFLCSSEHEGFCIPLVEAMCFDIPIIAYKFTAIPDTLMGSGILLEEKDPVMTACWINRLMNDKVLRETIIKKQQDILKEYQYQPVGAKFLQELSSFIEKNIKVSTKVKGIQQKLVSYSHSLENKRSGI